MEFKLLFLFIGLGAVCISVILYLRTEQNKQIIASKRRRDRLRLDRARERRGQKRRRGIHIER